MGEARGEGKIFSVVAFHSAPQPSLEGFRTSPWGRFNTGAMIEIREGAVNQGTIRYDTIQFSTVRCHMLLVRHSSSTINENKLNKLLLQIDLS